MNAVFTKQIRAIQQGRYTFRQDWLLTCLRFSLELRNTGSNLQALWSLKGSFLSHGITLEEIQTVNLLQVPKLRLILKAKGGETLL